MKKIPFLLLLIMCFSSCSENETITGIETIAECKQMPAYINKSKFNLKTAGFSTSVKRKPGLHLVDVTSENNTWQDPSWSSVGSLGPVVLDEKGNAYVVPVPAVNTLNNYAKNQNNLYKVDATTGKLNLLCSLEKYGDSSIQNPFGLMGLIYDCENHLLYVSSVYGSLPDNENGAIYVINPEDGKVLDVLKNTDAMGLGLANLNGQKRLFFGSARNAELWSITLDEEGKFDGKKRLEFSINGVGPRGDDRIRKIRFTPDAKIQLYGVEFYFNLIAPTEKQESIYYYEYDASEKGEWKFIKTTSEQQMIGY